MEPIPDPVPVPDAQDADILSVCRFIDQDIGMHDSQFPRAVGPGLATFGEGGEAVTGGEKTRRHPITRSRVVLVDIGDVAGKVGDGLIGPDHPPHGLTSILSLQGMGVRWRWPFTVSQTLKPFRHNLMRDDAPRGHVSARLGDGAGFPCLIHIIEDRTGLFHANDYRTRCIHGQAIGGIDRSCVTFAMSRVWKR